MEYHYRSKRLKRALPQGFHAITFSVHFSEVSAVVVELFTYSKISKLVSKQKKNSSATTAGVSNGCYGGGFLVRTPARED